MSREDRLYPDRPILGCLAIVRRAGRVLLAQRSVPPGIGQWGFPGGIQELGETIEECARRELREETGIIADPVAVLTAFDRIERDESGRVRTHFTLVAVLLEWRAGKGEPIEDAAALGWFMVEEARARGSELFPRVEELMQMALDFGSARRHA